MKKALRITGFGLLLILVALQFFRAPRNTGATEGLQSIIAREKIPAEEDQRGQSRIVLI